MYMRLGFAVAVNAEPDVLLVDEVLAVGDEAFQRKCLDRVRHFQREGRTIVFVTHAPDLVRQICQKAIVLDHGKEVASGSPGQAIRSFREHLLMTGDRPEVAEAMAAALEGSTDGSLDGRGDQERRRNFKVRITGVRFEHPGEEDCLRPGEAMTVAIAYEARERVDAPSFGFAIYDIDGNLLTGTNTRILGTNVDHIEGKGEVRFSFDSIPLLDGTYFLTLAVTNQDEDVVYDWQEQRHRFEVMNPGLAQGMLYMPTRVEVRS